MQIELSCTVNGVQREASVYPMARLLDVLRDEMQLTDQGQGLRGSDVRALLVSIVGRRAGNSCLIPALQAQGANYSHDRRASPAARQAHASRTASLVHAALNAHVARPG